MNPQRSRWYGVGNLLSIGSALVLLAILGLGLLGPGCREQTTAPVDRNFAPETLLPGVPGDSTTNFYRQHLYWTGYDRDGEVVGYEWAITDSLPPLTPIEYKFTTRTDSIFTFGVEETREVLGHRFYVRAIDNEGKRDPTPAYSFFAVRDNCVPTAAFRIAEAFGPNGESKPITSTNITTPGDTVPSNWGVRFSWTGFDCDRSLTPEGVLETVGKVVGFDHRLAPVEINWVRGSVADTTAAFDASRLRSATFEMRVRARDDAGLTGLDPAVRAFVYNYDPVTSFDRALLPGHADSLPYFEASTDGATGVYLTYTAGDTLPFTLAGAKIRAKVHAVDPDPPYRIAAVQARIVKDAAFWVDLGADYTFREDRGRYTGNYRLMTRSLDGLDRWDGTPAEIPFYINKQARFRDSWKCGPDSTLVLPRPAEGGVYLASNRDTMRVRIGAVDPDMVLGTMTGLGFQYKFDSYPLPGGFEGTETLYYRDWVVGDFDCYPRFVLAGSLKLQDPTPADPPPQFIPGDYVLRVRVREMFNSAADEEKFGYRIAERVIHFRLQ